MQTFPEWLRAALDDRHWTGGDLERASGVNNSLIWRCLSKRPRRPSPANLKRIAPPLGADYEELMRMCGYLPGETVNPVGSELDSHLARYGQTLARYPRVIWLAVIQANEAMAEAMAQLVPPVSDLKPYPFSDSDDAQNGGGVGNDDQLTPSYRPLFRSLVLATR